MQGIQLTGKKHSVFTPLCYSAFWKSFLWFLNALNLFIIRLYLHVITDIHLFWRYTEIRSACGPKTKVMADQSAFCFSVLTLCLLFAFCAPNQIFLRERKMGPRYQHRNYLTMSTLRAPTLYRIETEEMQRYELAFNATSELKFEVAMSQTDSLLSQTDSWLSLLDNSMVISLKSINTSIQERERSNRLQHTRYIQSFFTLVQIILSVLKCLFIYSVSWV